MKFRPYSVVDNIVMTTLNTVHRPTGFYPISDSEMIFKVDGRKPPTRWSWFWLGVMVAAAIFAMIAAVL